MAQATLRKLVTEYASDSVAQIDNLINVSGFLQTARVAMSNKGTFHTYKKVSALPTAAVRNRGGAYTPQTVDDEIKQQDLKLIGILQSEPYEICNEVGVAKYFAQQRPAHYEAIGQKISQIAFYGTNATFGVPAGWFGFHEIAKANGKRVQCGGASGSRSTIFCVKYAPDKCELLVNGKTMQAGSLIRTVAINGGNVTMDATSTSTFAQKPVYKVMYETDMAFLSTTNYDVSTMTQIQNAATDLPTADRMNEIIDMVKGTSADTILYMSRQTYRMVKALKEAKLTVYPANTEYNNQIDTWDGIPIVIDENISDAETTAVD